MTSPTKTDFSSSPEIASCISPQSNERKLNLFDYFSPEKNKYLTYPQEEKDRIEKIIKELMDDKANIDREAILKLSEDAFNKYIEKNTVDPSEWLVFDGDKFIGSFKNENEAREKSYQCLFAFIRRADGTELSKIIHHVLFATTTIKEDRRCIVTPLTGLPSGEKSLALQIYESKVLSKAEIYNEDKYRTIQNYQFPPRYIEFYIDTGSSCSVLERSIVYELGLPELYCNTKSDGKISTFSGSIPIKYYRGLIGFEATKKLYPVVFLSYEDVNNEKSKNINNNKKEKENKNVIGMDILSQMSLFMAGGKYCILNDI